MSGKHSGVGQKDPFVVARDLAIGCIRSLGAARVAVTNAWYSGGRSITEAEVGSVRFTRAIQSIEQTFVALNDHGRRLRDALTPALLTTIEVANSNDHGLIQIGRMPVTTFHQAAAEAVDRFVEIAILPPDGTVALPEWVCGAILGIQQVAIPGEHFDAYAYYSGLGGHVRSHALPEIEQVEAGIQREYALAVTHRAAAPDAHGADTSPGQHLRDDLITTAAAVSRYHVTPRTIRRMVGDGRLTDYRPVDSKRNSPYLLSEAELSRHLPMRR